MIKMNVAVFADVHGRLLLCLKVCARWQRETGEKLDLILQAGDMGTFPDTTKLDCATIQHARHDSTELGFSQYFVRPNSAVERVLAELGDCNLIYVRGNHEDHAWLDSLEQRATGPIFPVDKYNRIFCLKSGAIYNFQKGSENLRILGISRIGQANRSPNSTEPIYIQPYEVKRLFGHNRATEVDVLLTHDIATPDKRQTTKFIPPKGGMTEIREALNIYKPSYYFFGHIGGPLLHYKDDNEQTEVYKLPDFDWTKDMKQVLAPNTMGILRWQNNAEHSFEVVPANWLQEYTAYNWQWVD